MRNDQFPPDSQAKHGGLSSDKRELVIFCGLAMYFSRSSITKNHIQLPAFTTAVEYCCCDGDISPSSTLHSIEERSAAARLPNP